jgi:Transposase, Mutator family
VPYLGTQLGIDGAAVHVLGLKLLIGPQAVNGLLQGIMSPDCLADGFTDRGLWVRFQQGSDGISGDEHGFKRWMIPMLIEPLHICPGTPTLLRRRCMFSTDTHRINTPGVIGQDRFEANVTLPMGSVIIDIPEALTSTETKCAQPNVSGLSPIAPIVLAVEVERVQMLAAPVQDDLEDGVELCQGGVAADEESAPDERTDLSEGDTQLIDTARVRWLAHRWSVAQYAVPLKASPRNLALSDAMPKKHQAEARTLLCAMPYAESQALCEELRTQFTKRYRQLAPKAVERLADDWERLVTFYQFPREHWRHLRTTNVVESPFAAVRLRTTAAKRFKKVDFATALIWKLLQVAEGTFRRLNAPELLPGVYVGVRYVDGVKPLSTATTQEVAA